MTKTNQLTYDALLNSSLNFSDEQLKFAHDLLEVAGKKRTKEKNSEHPDILNEDGAIKEKWCGKHLAYEPIEDYTMKSNDKYDANCDVAIKQWRAYTKVIKGLEKLNTEVINKGIPEETQKHLMKVEAAKLERQGAYEYPTETEDDLREEA